MNILRGTVARVFLAAILALAGGAWNAPAHGGASVFPSGIVAPRTDFGLRTLASIQARYADSASDCGGNDEPALLCSGVVIRGTDFSTAYHAWNPSPQSVQRDGVSFSYIRHDANFVASGYRSGFTFAPADASPWATYHPDAICSFPRNAATANRGGRGGCGMNGTAAVSGPCQPQNVLTGAQWRTHFAQQAGNSDGLQCGFTITPGASGGAAAGFMASLLARTIAPPYTTHNEVVITAWPQDIGASIPLESFFYYAGGLDGARSNQWDLYVTDGVAVPIIEVTLPNDPTGTATFAFRAADQRIEAPSLAGSFDLPPSVPLAPLGALRLQDVLDHPAVNVLIPAPSGVRSGDLGRVRWMGDDTVYETQAKVLSQGTVTSFAVPRAAVLATLGQSVAVTFAVTSHSPAATERVSPVRTIAVQASPVALPRAVVAADRRYVTIDYPMAVGDRVRVKFEGSQQHEIPHLVNATGPFVIGLPPDWFARPPGRLYYEVQPVNQAERYVSPAFVLGALPQPVVHDAPNGWLDLGPAGADPTVTVPPWQGIAPGQTLRLEARASAADGSEQRLTLANAPVTDAIVRDGLTAPLPREWLQRLPDGSAMFLMASADLSGGGVHFPVTRLTVRNTGGPMLTKPLPRVVDALADGTALPVDAAIARSALQGELQVRVAPWPGMIAGQRVWLRLRQGDDNAGSVPPVELAVNYTVVAADLSSGLVRTVPLDALDRFADGVALNVELKVLFEFGKAGANETMARAFPVNRLAYGH